MTVETTETPESIEGIQYLRGVASLMVVFFHARSYFGVVPDWTRVGSRGVDIFFVISGFIMVYATRNIGNDVSAIKSSITFLTKRFIRVVPLYWIALLFTASPYLISWLGSANSLLDLYSNTSVEVISIAKDFAFIPHLSIDEDEAGEIFPILIQGWTLNYEVAFYVLFGFSILVGQYRLIMTAAIIVGLVFLGRFHHFHYVSGQFYTSTILLEFVFGMLVYEIYTKTHHLVFSRMTIISLSVLGLLLLNIGSGTNDKIVLGTAAAIIVWVFIQVFRGVHYWPLKLLGDASYSIYLFHLASFKLARSIVAYLELSPVGYGNIIMIIFIHVVISVVTGIGVYYVVEKPLLRLFRYGLVRAAKWRYSWLACRGSAAG